MAFVIHAAENKLRKQLCAVAVGFDSRVHKPANSVLLLQVTRNKNSSFSAVSTPIFTIKYSLESSRRDLQIPHSTRDLKFQFFAKNPDLFGRFFFHAKNRQFLN